MVLWRIDQRIPRSHTLSAEQERDVQRQTFDCMPDQLNLVYAHWKL